jgi:predicted AlkP superfamily pyrophosphatase or phosphodiesterase
MSDPNLRVLVIGADGLRPDLVDRELMPNLAKLEENGVRFTDHHAAYPSHTRVNSSTFSTGRTPGQHGIVANTMIVPGATDDHIVDTGNYQHLDAMGERDSIGTQLTESLSDILVRHGHRVAVAGNGSSGSNVLWTFKDRGRIVNPNSAYGIADLYDLRDKLGALPEKTVPAIAGIDYVTRAVTDIFLNDANTKVITLWLAEPDSSLHYRGLGSPESMEALKYVDAAIGSILDAMEREGVRDQFNILFLSDHGHSTVRAHKTLREYLADARADLNGRLPELVTASDYIYATPGTAEPATAELAPLVEWLDAQPWVDVILGGTEELANLPGVLPLRELWNGHINHRRPLLAVSPTWNDDLNEFGVRGVVSSLTTQSALKSSHGSLSPYDMHATFIASGPSFRQGVMSDIPTGATDIMPTMLWILGLPIPDGLDGRVLHEGLDGVGGAEVSSEDILLEPATAGSNPRNVRLHRVGGTTYVHGSTTGGSFLEQAASSSAFA